MEYRYDTDGNLYSKAEFEEFYGPACVEWDNAQRQESSSTENETSSTTESSTPEDETSPTTKTVGVELDNETSFPENETSPTTESYTPEDETSPTMKPDDVEMDYEKAQQVSNSEDEDSTIAAVESKSSISLPPIEPYDGGPFTIPDEGPETPPPGVKQSDSPGGGRGGSSNDDEDYEDEEDEEDETVLSTTEVFWDAAALREKHDRKGHAHSNLFVYTISCDAQENVIKRGGTIHAELRAPFQEDGRKGHIIARSLPAKQVKEDNFQKYQFVPAWSVGIPKKLEEDVVVINVYEILDVDERNNFMQHLPIGSARVIGSITLRLDNDAWNDPASPNKPHSSWQRVNIVPDDQTSWPPSFTETIDLRISRHSQKTQETRSNFLEKKQKLRQKTKMTSWENKYCRFGHPISYPVLELVDLGYVDRGESFLFKTMKDDERVSGANEEFDDNSSKLEDVRIEFFPYIQNFSSGSKYDPVHKWPIVVSYRECELFRDELDESLFIRNGAVQLEEVVLTSNCVDFLYSMFHVKRGTAITNFNTEKAKKSYASEFPLYGYSSVETGHYFHFQKEDQITIFGPASERDSKLVMLDVERRVRSERRSERSERGIADTKEGSEEDFEIEEVKNRLVNLQYLTAIAKNNRKGTDSDLELVVDEENGGVATTVITTIVRPCLLEDYYEGETNDGKTGLFRLSDVHVHVKHEFRPSKRTVEKGFTKLVEHDILKNIIPAGIYEGACNGLVGRFPMQCVEIW
eukprot:g4863.t1